MARAYRSVVVAIHGTFDGEKGDIGEKWWQVESEFSTNFLKSLSEKPVNASGDPGNETFREVEWRPFHWSAENSDQDRTRAGRKLVFHLNRLVRKYDEVIVIAHSHGGNIVREALRRSRHLKPNKHNIRFFTVGTPVLKKRITATGALASIADYLGFALAPFLLIGVPIGALIWSVGVNDSGLFGILFEYFPESSIAIVATMVALVATARRGVPRFLRRRKNFPIHEINHGKDEAITLLSNLERSQIKPLSPRAARRSSANTLTAVVLLNLLLFPLWLFAIAPQVEAWRVAGENLEILEDSTGLLVNGENGVEELTQRSLYQNRDKIYFWANNAKDIAQEIDFSFRISWDGPTYHLERLRRMASDYVDSGKIDCDGYDSFRETVLGDPSFKIAPSYSSIVNFKICAGRTKENVADDVAIFNRQYAQTPGQICIDNTCLRLEEIDVSPENLEILAERNRRARLAYIAETVSRLVREDPSRYNSPEKLSLNGWLMWRRDIFLRGDVNPSNTDDEKLIDLAKKFIERDKKELRERADWGGLKFDWDGSIDTDLTNATLEDSKRARRQLDDMKRKIAALDDCIARSDDIREDCLFDILRDEAFYEFIRQSPMSDEEYVARLAKLPAFMDASHFGRISARLDDLVVQIRALDVALFPQNATAFEKIAVADDLVTPAENEKLNAVNDDKKLLLGAGLGLLVIVTAFRGAIGFLIGPINGFISNGVVQGAMRSSAFGADGNFKVGFDRRFFPDAQDDEKRSLIALPTQMADDLYEKSKETSARALSLVRDTIDSDTDLLRLNLDEIMTWEELVHTSYFRHPDFAAFMAEAVDRAGEKQLPK